MSLEEVGDKIECLICGGHLSVVEAGVFDTRFGIQSQYSIGHCTQCGNEQTIPLPTGEELKTLYEENYNFSGESNTRYTMLRSWFLNSWLYKLWQAFDGDISFHSKRGKGRLIDVGCNEGRGLSIYSANGFDAEGLELNEVAAGVARKNGYVVHTQLLEDFHPTDRYDVVVLSNVLEHSLNPQDMLQNVRRILRDGGEVWISCPNNQSLLRTVFGSTWINWHVPFHIVHFSNSTLSNVLKENGFTNVVLKNETPALWVAHSIIARLFAVEGEPTRQLRQSVLIAALMLSIRGLLFPLLWLMNSAGKGDCIVAEAKKISQKN